MTTYPMFYSNGSFLYLKIAVLSVPNINQTWGFEMCQKFRNCSNLTFHPPPRSSLFSLEMVFLLWISSILGSDIFRKWVLNSIVFLLMTIFWVSRLNICSCLFVHVRLSSIKFVKCSLMNVRFVTKQFHSRMMILHVETSIFYNVRLLWTLEYFLPIS